jgi:hypothetical protein
MVFNFAADGRTFTDFNSPCLVNEKIMKDNKITNAGEYRLFLQRNGNAIADISRKNSAKSACDCRDCKNVSVGCDCKECK